MVETPQKLSSTLVRKLNEVYSDDGPERCGVLLRDGTMVELKNISAKPEDSFVISIDDMLHHEDEMVATFHTHPGEDSNLSWDDYVGFQGWPDLAHIIVGKDGISVFVVNEKEAVVRHEAHDHSPR